MSTHTTAYTMFIGHKMDTGYLRSLARKGISKIDSNIDVITKDGEKLRVKTSHTEEGKRGAGGADKEDDRGDNYK